MNPGDLVRVTAPCNSELRKFSGGEIGMIIGRGTPTPLAWTHNARQVAGWISGGRCCPKAETVPCVCEVSYKCPDHGVRCRGSHD